MKIKNALTGLLFASLLPLTSVSVAGDSGVSVENPYARAVPPTARNSGAFMLIRNTSDEPRKVVDAKSDVSNVTELHDHIHDNGVMRMRRVEAIAVPAGGSVELKPGSYHVMLIDLKAPLKADDPVHIDLTLDDGTVLPIDLKARSVMGNMGNMGGMHHKHH